MTAEQIDPETTYLELLPQLREAERDWAAWIEVNVIRVLAQLAGAATGRAAEIRELRAVLTELAAALGREVPVPEIPLNDPDGALWSAMQAGDVRAVAEAFGRLAGALIAESG